MTDLINAPRYDRAPPVSPNPDAAVIAGHLSTSLRMYRHREHRVGMRSGMLDAAAVCDIIRDDLLKGRTSRQKTLMAEVAQRCADAIEAARQMVTV